ncbi:ABC transporter ATP-binding protein [Ignavigranum ruoffiae]|uniref:ABC transporter ATP-binding protein n=1 Tax=Ignavigranum ruoffiae TaxID=89093 RepID=UPI0024AE5EF1|nr:ABC transporter ATP-binding protein [Ignavigranum ruoffiae]
MLEVEHLYSGYQNVAVIQDVSFNLKAGQITGLIGLNGAGKSTLLKTILGLLPIQSGRVAINQQTLDQDHQAYARQIAYIPETPILYEGLTLQEHIEMTALGYGLDRQTALDRAQPLLERFRLAQNLNWFPTHFSKGMKQKVMVICALITDAQLFIIDEPFLGLDPLAIRDLTDLLKGRAEAGAAILLTTHVLSIAPNLCDHYLLLQKGQLKGAGNLADLRQHFEMPSASLEDIYIRMTEGVVE